MESVRIHDFELLRDPQMYGIDQVVAQAALENLRKKLAYIKPVRFASPQEIILSLGPDYGLIPIQGDVALDSRRAFMELGKWPEEKKFDCVIVGLLWNMREVAHVLVVRPATNGHT